MSEEPVSRARPRTRWHLVRLAAAVAAAGTAVAGTAVTTGDPAADAQAACAAVEVVTARGTWEPQDSSYLLTQVVDKIEPQLDDTTAVYDVVYPAQPTFPTSAPQGVTDLVDHLNTGADRCPDQRYILLGYSQGALVVGDALVAPADRAYGGEGTLSDAAAAQVASVGMFGSMRFTGGEPYNAGDHDPALSSALPRPPGALSAYEDVIIDYCYAGDWVCQSSGSFLTHLGYIGDAAAQQEVADFVVDAYNSGMP